MNNCKPPIAKIMKKKINITILSKSNLIAEKSEVSMILRDLMLEIVLSGLKTLKTLRELKLLLSPPEMLGSQAVITIMKSKIFQPSLM